MQDLREKELNHYTHRAQAEAAAREAAKECAIHEKIFRAWLANDQEQLAALTQ